MGKVGAEASSTRLFFKSLERHLERFTAEERAAMLAGGAGFLKNGLTLALQASLGLPNEPSVLPLVAPALDLPESEQ